MEVIFHADASRFHLGHGFESFGFLRRFEKCLLKQDSSPASLKCKPKERTGLLRISKTIEELFNALCNGPV